MFVTSVSSGLFLCRDQHDKKIEKASKQQQKIIDEKIALEKRLQDVSFICICFTMYILMFKSDEFAISCYLILLHVGMST